jgi:hypothetical protein
MNAIQWLGQAAQLPTREEFRRMTVAQIDQRAARIPAAERAELFQAGLLALPPCWDQRAESCAGNADGPYLPEPQCTAIMGGYFGNRAQMQKAIDAVPICVAETRSTASFVLPALIGLAVGVIALSLLR